MKRNKLSFDFDGVLSIPTIQNYAKGLIDKGFEIWVTTSRYNEDNKHKFPYSPTNEDLFKVCDDLGILRERVIFTNMTIKFGYLDNSFLFHIDDQFMELKYIELNTSIKPVYVGMGNDWKTDCEYAICLEQLKKDRTMIKREDLDGFGAVEICQETEDGFEIKITTGFSNQASKVFTLMSKINGLIGEQYPTIKSMHADEGIFHAIYVRKKGGNP